MMDCVGMQVCMLYGRDAGDTTYMQSRATLLHPHIMSLTQNFAIFVYEASSNRYATFACAFLGFLHCGFEACVVLRRR